LLAGIADTAGFTKGAISYGPNKISLSCSNGRKPRDPLYAGFDRTFEKDDKGNLLVHHGAFFLPKSNQKGGNAVNMMADALPVYDELGVFRITIEAVGVGKHAWLRCGFIPDKEDAVGLANRILDSLPAFRQQFPDVAKEDLLPIEQTLARMRGGDARAAWDLADNDAKMPDGKQTIANYLLVNVSGWWDGDFDMRDPITRKRCQEYIDSKSGEYSNYSLDI